MIRCRSAGKEAYDVLEDVDQLRVGPSSHAVTFLVLQSLVQSGYNLRNSVRGEFLSKSKEKTCL